MVFAFLFGLSMDYEVFILSRIREEYDRTGSTDRAVVVGIGRTGRLVTSAALILFLGFLSLSTAGMTDLKVMATGLGAGILLDAVVVRSLAGAGARRRARPVELVPARLDGKGPVREKAGPGACHRHSRRKRRWRPAGTGRRRRTVTSQHHRSRGSRRTPPPVPTASDSPARRCPSQRRAGPLCANRLGRGRCSFHHGGVLSSVWPLFGLRIETPRLLLRVPADRDFPGLLSAIDAGIHDPQVMPFSIPWTDVEPEERRRRAIQHWWKERAEWSAEAWRASFGVFLDGRPVGIQSLHAETFAVLGEVSTGSWLTSLVQGQGLGKEMRAAILELAFEGLGAEVARSAAFVDNSASVAVSRALGYRENGRMRLAPRRVPQVMVEFELTRNEWLKRRSSWPEARISGLASCREMFGPADGR